MSVTENELRRLVENRFIAPTRKKRKLYAGVELELPIVNLNRTAVDFAVVHDLTLHFKEKFNFEESKRDEDGNVCALENEAGDIFTYDCSYNNFEISLGKAENLCELDIRLTEYLLFIQKTLRTSNHALTGMGINPYRKYNVNEPIHNGRYRMLFHYLSSYKNFSGEKQFHSLPCFGMFCSASQVQLDIEYENLIPAIKAFNKLEPFKALLFSNSVLNGEDDTFVNVRDMLWADSMQGVNPKNVGMHEPAPSSIEELIDYILDASIYCTEREGRYYNFSPIPLREYYAQDTITGEYFDEEIGAYKTSSFTPQLEDFEYLRTFKFQDLTFRGTIEFRSVCAQPISHRLAPAAFHLGLFAHTEELQNILDNDTSLYGRGASPSVMRELANGYRLPDFISKEALQSTLLQILILSECGLRARGFGEEKYLLPLYERAKALKNPGQLFLDSLASGNDEQEIILKYGEI
ncbi:MAG: glutamylcysteine synthetase [Oscillospiraceae bacterium]|jgi:gamma-glutamylcysteine synthetase|nr:glutamylcysteine synthetase [Oscillospiraceae bacterium]